MLSIRANGFNLNHFKSDRSRSQEGHPIVFGKKSSFHSRDLAAQIKSYGYKKNCSGGD